MIRHQSASVSNQTPRPHKNSMDASENSSMSLTFTDI